MLSVLSQEHKREEEQRVIRSPSNERPVRPVPKSADEENNQSVAHNLPLAAPAAAERDVDVVAKPGGERNMPSAPELCHIAREIREGEVSHQPKAEQPCRPDCNIGVSREVSVDLEGEQNATHKQRNAALVRVIAPNLIHDGGAVVGNDHFLEKSPQNLTATVHSLSIIEAAGFMELRQKVLCPLNRTRNQLRKERYVGEKGDSVLAGGNLFAVNVNRVAHSLKGVEADADGKHEIERERVGVQAERAEKPREVVGKEIIVLEDAEYPNVESDVCEAECFPGFGTRRILVNHPPEEVAQNACQGDKKQKPHVPPPVEHVACRQKQHVLRPLPPEYEPIEQENRGQKDEKLNRIEQHKTKPSLACFCACKVRVFPPLAVLILAQIVFLPPLFVSTLPLNGKIDSQFRVN